MSKNITVFTDNVIENFLSKIENHQKIKDSKALIKLMAEATGEQAKMFGSSIIGFGKYQYRYESGHEGEAPLISFSPRKAAISLYVYSSTPIQDKLLSNLGKYKMGKSCIYINKLSDIDLNILQKIMESTIAFLSEKYRRIN
ncbi:MAG: DUF1801 domain-containing protein [Sphingobacterium composti]|uniref:DUF1801 domain-containing protein n=1 Tax=Sphingobacterium composti TaxID=363260 RepID=UPI001359B487|nr:DUF1801 domain-containing protein [Sphingobacterium composti Ten et al. 2007 non Yoo et al. 2007]